MTVEQLEDIVQSQLCVHGNNPLFLRNNLGQDSFQLFVGGKSILECVPYDETDKEEYGLQVLANRLTGLDSAAPILCSNEQIQAKGFQIGYLSVEDGFVETINSTELLGVTIID